VNFFFVELVIIVVIFKKHLEAYLYILKKLIMWWIREYFKIKANCLKA